MDYVEADSRRRLFTVKDFERAGELGIFAPGERLELIEGEIISKVTPMSAPHAGTVIRVDGALRDTFGEGFIICMQLPMVFGRYSEPEPDLYVLIGDPHDYLKAHPSTSPLVVEVADVTLRLDRTLKESVYARAGIPEYWIINLPDSVLEVHREPDPPAGKPRGRHHYHSITRLTATDSITPLAAPESAILVADLLPRASS